MFQPCTTCNIKELEISIKLLPHFYFYKLHRVRLFSWQKT
jgi:hypothetical protein